MAIRGASFESTGDIASEPTGGGLISANTHGPARFISPGSLSVTIEGRNVHLLADCMFNNCGDDNGPPNSATLAGVVQQDLATDSLDPLDPCDEMRQAIYALMEELARRYTQLRQNVNDLPLTGTNSVEGHRQQMRGKQRSLRNLLNDYGDCPDPPPSGAWELATRQIPYPIADGRWNATEIQVEVEEPAGEGLNLPVREGVTILAGAGTVYVIYRIARMAPSVVFPPLWPTIPANAVIP